MKYEGLCLWVQLQEQFVNFVQSETSPTEERIFWCLILATHSKEKQKENLSGLAIDHLEKMLSSQTWTEDDKILSAFSGLLKLLLFFNSNSPKSLSSQFQLFYKKLSQLQSTVSSKFDSCFSNYFLQD